MVLDVELKPIEIIIVSIFLAFPLAAIYSTILDSITEQNRVRALVQARIENAESRAEQAPEKAKFAWELATVRLEAYFDRNLSQVSQVFWLAVVVTTVGFFFILWGIVASLNQPQFTARAVIAGVAGVITQFIGATFLVIYRSIMAQANEFIAVLERINTVGMAVQVLDSIPEDQVELKNSTRSNLVALLAGMKPPV
jgi:nitrate reductase gamma subunit